MNTLLEGLVEVKAFCNKLLRMWTAEGRDMMTFSVFFLWCFFSLKTILKPLLITIGFHHIC